ncbi:MAG TPA: hypothetical protein VFV34_12690, partial [Blastocatellia bacterium]|nr:hypothetical protein [Blastocatellia bacterium]
VLFLMLSGSSSAGKAGSQVRSSGQAQTAPASNGNSNASQSAQNSNSATSQSNKNGDPRGKRRYYSGSGSKYKDVYTVEGSGKAPKMVQSQ